MGLIFLNSTETTQNNLTPYLNSMLFILSHPNHSITSIALQFWREFVKSSKINNLVFDEQFVNSVIGTIPSKLIKKQFIISEMYLEFDDVEDYEAFYFKYRADILELLRNLTLRNETVCFKYIMNLLQTTLINHCNSSTEWEILATLLDATLRKLTKTNQV